jgi:tRNA (Thr-GGU) A37 N-methylase
MDRAAVDTVVPIGVVDSPIRTRGDAPRQAGEGAPPAWLDIDPAYAAALDGIEPGSEIVVLTWLPPGRPLDPRPCTPGAINACR